MAAQCTRKVTSSDGANREFIFKSGSVFFFRSDDFAKWNHTIARSGVRVPKMMNYASVLKHDLCPMGRQIRRRFLSRKITISCPMHHHDHYLFMFLRTRRLTGSIWLGVFIYDPKCTSLIDYKSFTALGLWH